MAELKVYLSEELAKRFRMLAMSVHGYGRGSLSKAAENALSKWCDDHRDKMPEIESKSQGPPAISDPAVRAEERPIDPYSMKEIEGDAVRQSK